MKTPWNPSRRAIKQVKNPLPAPTQCQYCDNTSIELVNNSTIYRKEYGKWPWMYLCIKCKSYVGLHPFTNIPLGTLADQETRNARKFAKSKFMKLLDTPKLTRSQAYQLLAHYMQIEYSKCHFGWFDVKMCSMAVISLDLISAQFS